MTLDEFQSLPVIMSFFPLTFTTGRQRWTNFAVNCNDCGQPVPSEQTRGHVDREVVLDGFRLIKSTCYNVVAHALCPHCDRMTTACYILHEDMTLTGLHPKTGEASRWKMRRLSLLERFIDWCKSLFNRDRKEG